MLAPGLLPLGTFLSLFWLLPWLSVLLQILISLGTVLFKVIIGHGLAPANLTSIGIVVNSNFFPKSSKAARD